MSKICRVFGLAVLGVLAMAFHGGPAIGNGSVLRIKQVASDGLVIADVNLTPAFRACGIEAGDWRGLKGQLETGEAVPLQFIPDADFEAHSRFAGMVILRLPHASRQIVHLRLDTPPSLPPDWDGTVRAGDVVVRCDPLQHGGFPMEFVFPNTGKKFRVSRWADRVHDPGLGSLHLTDDPQPEVLRLSEGPLCTVIRVRARYGASRTSPPPGRPFAVYDWIYFHDRPLILVRASAYQQEIHPWAEHHFLELQFNQSAMSEWVVGDPVEKGTFANTGKSYRGEKFGYISNGENALGIVNGGTVLIYDSPGEDANYIQARGNQAWQTWDTPVLKKSALIWLGAANEASSQLAALSQTWPLRTEAIPTTSELVSQLSQVRKTQGAMRQDEREKTWWVQAAEALEDEGRLEEADALARSQLPSGWTLLSAGALGLILERAEGGAKIFGVYDIHQGRLLPSSRETPIFEMALQNTAQPESPPRLLRADQGWKEVTVTNEDGVTVVWKDSQELPDAKLEMVMVLKPSAEQSASAAELSVWNVAAPWSIRHVSFPQLAVVDLGSRGCVLYPQGCGIAAVDPWSEDFKYQGRYPSGWTTMQFLAVYEPELQTGLYLGMHDPVASTKEITVRTLPDKRLLQLSYQHWAPNIGRAGNAFTISGQAVWALLRGDWYDASQIYRDWVTQRAEWYPHLGDTGRVDTPLWMRELPLWALYGGPAGQCAEQTKQFGEFFGVPCAVHWYNWHLNPFDNDYPHYFPTRPEFPPGVEELRNAGIHVMPYINGRLWDTRDKGMEDWQFTERALPFATKNEQGEPFVETYGSKESDGSPVRLAVMCPSTQLWQDTVREIALRLFREFKVDAVYIDQIAAAAPTLCCDPSHGHPLGGGHWWTAGYWKLLDAIRREKPTDCIITTECNAEPYLRWMDGYLTWHWQYDGQVPAFPAVYSGAIQMFGRSYGGGPTRDLALRMRAAQQMVFGEQLGWIAPSVIHEEENAKFFRQLCQLRWQLRKYFYAGRMLRPPKFESPVSSVKADWQWRGTRWVTTESVLTGAWWLPSKSRVVIIVINVSDAVVKTTLVADLRPVPWRKTVNCQPLSDAPMGTWETVPDGVRFPVEIPSRTAWAWEISSANEECQK